MAENKTSGQRVVVKELKQTDHEAQVAFVHEVAILKAIRSVALQHIHPAQLSHDLTIPTHPPRTTLT
jgi:hypothetical protein